MSERKPQRKCVGCGQVQEKNNMVRLVKAKDSANIVLDNDRHMDGRGAYICKDIKCLEKARKSKGLEKSFRMSVPALIYDSLEKEFVFGSK